MWLQLELEKLEAKETRDREAMQTGHRKTDCWHDVKHVGTGVSPPPKKHQELRSKANTKAGGKAFS
eukprot:3768408-Karenia_brevis.AAC.1